MLKMWRARYIAVEPIGSDTPAAAAAPAAPAAPAADSMGLSFFILWRHHTRFVGHTGSQAGFRSFFYINPVTRAAVVAAFNTRNDARAQESAAGFRAVRDQALALIAK